MIPKLKEPIIRNQPWCLRCDTIGEFETTTEIRKAVVKGVNVEFEAIKAYCPKCGDPLFLYEAEKVNQIRCFDEYKRKKGLLTSEEIIEIRKKYGLSQTQLAETIKVGKKNIARYELGAIQDASIDLLIRLLNNHPELFDIKIEKPNRKTLKAFKEADNSSLGKRRAKI